MPRLVAFAVSLVALARVAAAQSTDASQAPPPAVSATPTQPAPAAPPAHAEAAPSTSTPQPEGRQWLRNLYAWGGVGTTFAFGNTYANVSGGVGYRMRAGITPNVELSYNFGSSPTLWTLRPGVTWFMPLPIGHPYVGAFYTHWFVGSGHGDRDGVGARAGFSIGRVLSLGVTYDHALDCQHDCDLWTPQISAGISL